MAYTVIARIGAKAGHDKEVEQACREMAAQVGQEPDTISYVMYRSAKEPGDFFVYEVYKDEAAFNHHLATPYMAALRAKLENKTESIDIDTLNEFARK